MVGGVSVGVVPVNVRNVRVNWGDGEVDDLGAISGSASPQYTYRGGGIYTVTATATMADGSTISPPWVR